ncbi:MAG: hypothetical protein R2686_07160 [Candidatus Nanopelagicales bacterium]
MTEHSYSGKCAFNLGGQTLFWNTGVAGVYTEDPATLTEETIAAAPGTAPVYTPESPNEITGEYGTDDGTILAGVVAVLASLGLVTDSTTSPE